MCLASRWMFCVPVPSFQINSCPTPSVFHAKSTKGKTNFFNSDFLTLQTLNCCPHCSPQFNSLIERGAKVDRSRNKASDLSLLCSGSSQEEIWVPPCRHNSNKLSIWLLYSHINPYPQSVCKSLLWWPAVSPDLRQPQGFDLIGIMGIHEPMGGNSNLDWLTH